MVNGKMKPAHYLFLINIVKCDKYTSDPAVIHPTQVKAYCFFYIIPKIKELITRSQEDPVTIIHYGNTIAFSTRLQEYLITGVNHSEPLHPYIPQLKVGRFLSPERKILFFKLLENSPQDHPGKNKENKNKISR